jgi:quinoprotein glucose dehydrogenase
MTHPDRLLRFFLLFLTACASQRAFAQGQDWYTFNGDLMAQKYSTATQITPQNVSQLKLAWQVHTGDKSAGNGALPATVWSATPLFVNDTVYIGTPFYCIFAIEPDNGKVKWTFDTHAKLKAWTQPDLKSRGVAYWQAANPIAGEVCQKIVYIGTMDAKLYAVDADTGKPCGGFGKGGVVSVDQWNTRRDEWPMSLLQPPTVYKNTLLLGWAGKDWNETAAPVGLFFALDAQTGALKWTFDPLPSAAQKNSGTANVWASVSADPKAGIIYLPVSSPSRNFFGGNRTDPVPVGTSITALDADSGKVLWRRQLVHHDLWDYDTNSAPVLVDLHRDGKTVPALIQSTKQGYFLVLNRLNGEPIYPIEEKSVPASDIQGEKSSPTQPLVSLPERAVSDRLPGISTIANIASAGYCSREFRRLRYDGLFTPPSIKGSLIYPATPGGVEWGGGAVDRATNTYIVNNSYVAQIYRLLPRKQYDEETHGQKKKDYYPMEGAPYGLYLTNFTNWLGMPCWAPPYGSIAAYDLDSGKQLWKEPFGEVQKWGFYMPQSWGSVTIGAPLITKTGLAFIGASMDSRVRALDEHTGKVMWKSQVDAPAVAMPATYTYWQAIRCVRCWRQQTSHTTRQRPACRLRVTLTDTSSYFIGRFHDGASFRGPQNAPRFHFWHRVCLEIKQLSHFPLWSALLGVPSYGRDTFARSLQSDG